MSPAAAAVTARMLAELDPATVSPLGYYCIRSGILAAAVNHPAVYRAMGMQVPPRGPKPVPPRPLPGVVVRRIRVRPGVKP